jgi:hypothetical protein
MADEEHRVNELASHPIAKLYFVRHGRSTHNESDEDRPLLWDASLHNVGIRQAALLRQRLQDIPLEIVVVSPLTRALQTALIALGDWRQLAPRGTAMCDNERATIEKIKPTVQMDEDGIRFDASDGDVSPLEGDCLGPGAKAQLLNDVKLRKGGTQRRGRTCTVTNVAVTLAGASDVRSCLDVFPTAASRCQIVAWPEATEQLHESDDLGSPAPELRMRFPTVDFSRLPHDNSTWWWSDPTLPESLDAIGARSCWEQHGRHGLRSGERLYDEPDRNLVRRIDKLVQGLDTLADKHKHLALFAHCWVLEEIWCQRFGKGRRFANAEVAVVDVLANGKWRWLKQVEDEESSSG